MKRSRKAWVGVDDDGTIYLGSIAADYEKVGRVGSKRSKVDPAYVNYVDLTPTRCTVVLAAPRPKKPFNRPAERRT